MTAEDRLAPEQTASVRGIIPARGGPFVPRLPSDGGSRRPRPRGAALKFIVVIKSGAQWFAAGDRRAPKSQIWRQTRRRAIKRV